MRFWTLIAELDSYYDYWGAHDDGIRFQYINHR